MKKQILIILFFLGIYIPIFILTGPTVGWTEPHEHEGGDLFTCPMHPDVIEDQPGTCPICKMDLVLLKTNVDAPTQDQKEASAPSGAKELREKKVKYWVAPMDPEYISDKPGKSPMGMDLVPVYKDEKNDRSAAGGEVRIDPVTVQNMGVRVAHVRRRELTRAIRTIGEVDIAEDALSVVNLRYSGWIEKIYVDETGTHVKKGQPLFKIYSPELVQAQQEYINAAKSAGPDSPLAASARTRLELAGVSSWLIKKLDVKNEAFKTITVSAPQSGYVLHKNVVEGSRIMAGKDLYRIGNLTAIWVNVELYEFDAPYIRAGLPATMELPFQKGKTYEGQVAYVYPTLDRKTRTLKARLEFPNPGLGLKPGMFATVWVEAERKHKVLAIPTEAILHSGQRQLVFVAKGGGRYEPRPVVTGLSGDGHLTEIISGLRENEVVVTSGQFLLDSESQLQEAVAKLLADRLEAKKENSITTAEPASDQHDHESESYWTCPMHPQILQDESGQCPICHMDLVEKKK
jgi:RND family efflux transporter MFP subunit